MGAGRKSLNFDVYFNRFNSDMDHIIIRCVSRRQNCGRISQLIPRALSLDPGTRLKTSFWWTENTSSVTNYLRTFVLKSLSRVQCNVVAALFFACKQANFFPIPNIFCPFYSPLWLCTVFYFCFIVRHLQGPTWDGRSGVHVHMTNTRITDPEIIERR